MRLERWFASLRPTVVAAVVAVVALGLTAWVWRHERAATEHALKADFDYSVRQAAHRIEARIASYEQMLRGVQGLFQVIHPVQREQFDAYVDSLLSGADFAGIQYFAYAALRPAGPAPTATAVIRYAAPAVGSNLKVVGDDPWADPARRTAMQLAGDSGGVAITPQLPDMIAGDRATQPGLMMFLPIYTRGQPVHDVAARRAALSGWVVAGVRMQDLMSSLYGEGTPGIDLSIFDGIEASRDRLMFESVPQAPRSRKPAFETLEYIGVAGHTWTLALTSRPEFTQRSGTDSAQIIAASGAGLSLLLALLMHQLVSGRQRAHSAADTVASELRASEERYRRIVETADEGIWMTDAQSRTTFVNPKLTQLLGYSREDFVGREWAHFLDDSPASDAERMLGAGRLLGSGPRELRFRRKDGGLVWASMTSTPVTGPAGEPAGALAMLTDIGAKKQAEATRSELEAQLRESQKMEAIGTLAGGIAHDFNNILAAILGNVDLARDHIAHGRAGQAELEQIGTAATRARSLVQQILAFSRRQPHRLVHQPLAPVVEESVRLLRPLLPALTELELKLPAEPLHVAADATQIQQVLMNLCTNAWHALGGLAGRITLGLDVVDLGPESARRQRLSAGRHAHLWISDTGVGMDEATRSRVFEPFFTTKPVGQGTGLGLSVVHGIVATHGGAITVTSKPGQGSRFDLLLPLFEPPSPASKAPVPMPVASNSAGSHVAYLDDDPVMLSMVQALLERCGYRVTCFADPAEALVVLCARPQDFDLVVSDYNMPGHSGIDVALALAKVRPGWPVIISSGFVSEDVLERAARAGVREVLQKEYTLERLPDIVQGLLQEPARKS